LPPVEAMACGTPVLTSNICALPETVGDAGVLVDPTDPEAIADGIRRLAEDTALIETLRQRGLARASRFTWNGTAARVLNVLQATLAEVRVSPLLSSKGR